MVVAEGVEEGGGAVKSTSRRRGQTEMGQRRARGRECKVMRLIKVGAAIAFGNMAGEEFRG